MNGRELVPMRLAELLLPQIGGGFDRKTGGFDRTKWGHRPYKVGVLTVKIEGVFGEYMAQNLHLSDIPFPF